MMCAMLWVLEYGGVGLCGWGGRGGDEWMVMCFV